MNDKLYVSEKIGCKLVKKAWLTAFSILLLTIVVTASAIVSLPHPGAARAAAAGTPTLQVFPNSQAYFSNTKLRVQGTNFPTTAETVNIYWDYQSMSNPGTNEGSVTSANGAFAFSFFLPLAPTAAYTLAAIGQTSGAIATTTFTLLPNLFVLPRAAGLGSKITTITGQAFGAGETVDLYWDCSSNCTGTPWQQVQADMNSGSFVLNNATVPTYSPYWNIPIFGIGESSHQSSLAKIIIYPPSLALAPVSGSASTQLTLTAYGFQSNEKVNAYWNGGTTPIFTVRTTVNGYVPAQVFTVPPGTVPGSYPVKWDPLESTCRHASLSIL